MFDEAFDELAQPAQRGMRTYWHGVWVRLALGQVALDAPSLAVALFSIALRHGESVASSMLASAADGLLGVEARTPREVFVASKIAGEQSGGDWIRRLEYVLDALTVVHMLRMRAVMSKPHHAVYAEVGRMMGD